MKNLSLVGLLLVMIVSCQMGTEEVSSGVKGEGEATGDDAEANDFQEQYHLMYDGKEVIKGNSPPPFLVKVVLAQTRAQTSTPTRLVFYSYSEGLAFYYKPVAAEVKFLGDWANEPVQTFSVIPAGDDGVFSLLNMSGEIMRDGNLIMTNEGSIVKTTLLTEIKGDKDGESFWLKELEASHDKSRELAEAWDKITQPRTEPYYHPQQQRDIKDRFQSDCGWMFSPRGNDHTYYADGGKCSFTISGLGNIHVQNCIRDCENFQGKKGIAFTANGGDIGSNCETEHIDVKVENGVLLLSAQDKDGSKSAAVYADCY